MAALKTIVSNSTKSNALEGAAQIAVDEYKKITESLRGFPGGDCTDVDPRWTMPPVSLRADT